MIYRESDSEIPHSEGEGSQQGKTMNNASEKLHHQNSSPGDSEKGQPASNKSSIEENLGLLSERYGFLLHPPETELNNHFSLFESSHESSKKNKNAPFETKEFFDFGYSTLKKTESGLDLIPHVFLVSDADIVEESFLEDINQMLGSQLPPVFQPEDWAPIRDQIREQMISSWQLTKDKWISSKMEEDPNFSLESIDEDIVFGQDPSTMTDRQIKLAFNDRINQNLCVVICLSPHGNDFRRRCRNFSGLVNSTQMSWFDRWSDVALYELAEKSITSSSIQIGPFWKLSCELLTKLQTIEKPSSSQTIINENDTDTPENPNSLQAKTLSEFRAESQQVSSYSFLPLDTFIVNIARIFVFFHSAVITSVESPISSSSGQIFITPSQYFSFLTTFFSILERKSTYIWSQSDTLSAGVTKLVDAKIQVDRMSIELKKTKAILEKAQKDCETLLVQIVRETRAADRRKAQAEQDKARLAIEEKQVLAQKTEAESDLARAEPALEAAQLALNSLNKKDLSEIAAYSKPPALVAEVLKAVMIIRNSPPTWAEAKKQIRGSTFLRELIEYDKDNMPDSILAKITKICAQPDFDAISVGKVSLAAKSLCLWVLAMETYGHVFREVAPKREALSSAISTLEGKRESLKNTIAELAELDAKLESLQQQYETSVSEKSKFKADFESTMTKLQRATSLISGLSSERARWEHNLVQFQAQLGRIVGDSLIASAMLSYCGILAPLMRSTLKTAIETKLCQYSILFTRNSDISNFLVELETIQAWQMAQLPSDNLSIQNAVFVWCAPRFPLMVDLQQQGSNWIQNVFPDSLILLDLSDGPKILKKLETAIVNGSPVLLIGIHDRGDKLLDTILSMQKVENAGTSVMKLGEKELTWNPDFRLFLSCKLSNPKFSPSIYARATLVNFSVGQQGLEEQILAIIVKHERQDLEEKRKQALNLISSSKTILKQLEAEILKLLNECTGSLVDDQNLVSTLHTSQKTTIQAKKSLQIASKTTETIAEARKAYLAAAINARVLYFALASLVNIESTYESNLGSYFTLFSDSLAKSLPGSSSFASDDTRYIGLDPIVASRVKNIIEFHTYSLFSNTCRGLFSKHRLLFSFLISIFLLKEDANLDISLLKFILSGTSPNRLSSQFDVTSLLESKPSWLPESAIKQLAHFSIVTKKTDLIPSIFENNTSKWKYWFLHPNPSELCLPASEDGSNIDELDLKASGEDILFKMGVFRILRPDCLPLIITDFVRNSLGDRYTKPLLTDIETLYADSSPLKPILYILSVGCDPTSEIEEFAAIKEIKFSSLALGKGQNIQATKLLELSKDQGHWLLLSNCHLLLSFLPDLEKMIRNFKNCKLHPNFRLWLSTKPNPKFPKGILQSSIRVTSEAPSGIKVNTHRLLASINPDSLTTTRCRDGTSLLKLGMATAFLHAILLERRKFGSMGFAIPYPFADSDFSVCVQMYSQMMAPRFISTPSSSSGPPSINRAQNEKNPKSLASGVSQSTHTHQDSEITPLMDIRYDILRYMLGTIHFGGRVTDSWDRRIINDYVDSLFVNSLCGSESLGFNLSLVPGYLVPALKSIKTDVDSVSTLGHMIDSIDSTFPTIDIPKVFGLHDNAQITSKQLASRELLRSISVLISSWSNDDDSSSSISLTELFGFLLNPDWLSSKASPSLDPENSSDPNEQISSSSKNSQASTDDSSGSGDDDILNTLKSDERALVVIISQALELLPTPSELEYIRPSTPNPLDIVLSQEYERYHNLVVLVRGELAQLRDCFFGINQISSHFENLSLSLSTNSVPLHWISMSYPTIKPFDSWLNDLLDRISFVMKWMDLRTLEKGRGGGKSMSSPPVFWLSALMYPSSFLTAVLQMAARRHSVLIDNLVWSFSILPQGSNPTMPPKNGVYVRGIFCEGAQWDTERNCLTDPEPLQLVSEMPIIHFQPVSKASVSWNKDQNDLYTYECPCYLYPIRTGTRERPSYVCTITLNSSRKAEGMDNMIQRGVAFLLSLSD